MKRIEFIAPVEAMRGNLSRSKQNLLYADNDNPAWDAPVNKRSYARNYQPIFVGAKVSKSGRKYFSVKTKTAITITPAVKKRMALLAASNEVANIIMQDLQLGQRTEILYMANHPEGWKYKRWLMYYIRQGLDQMKVISFPGYEALSALHVINPYISKTQPSDAADIRNRFPDELLVKFWPQLNENPVTFTVDGMVGIGSDYQRDETFHTLVDAPYNVLGVTLETIGVDQYPKIEDQYIKKGNNYADAGDNIGGEQFTLTDVAPEA